MHRGLLVARGAGMARHVTGVYDLRYPDRALAALSRAHGIPCVQLATAEGGTVDVR
jgi:ferric-dicitrate binding protein FerR (iron transport regulator)